MNLTINFSKSGRRGSNPRPAAWKAAALPTELLPHNIFPLWGDKDLNLGIPKKTDLQSVAFDHLAISPNLSSKFKFLDLTQNNKEHES